MVVRDVCFVIQLSTQWTVENFQTNHSAFGCKSNENQIQKIFCTHLLRTRCKCAHATSCGQTSCWSQFSRMHACMHACRRPQENCLPRKSNRTIYSASKYSKYSLQLSSTLMLHINLLERRITAFFRFIKSKIVTLFVRSNCKLMKEGFSIYGQKSSSVSTIYFLCSKMGDRSNETQTKFGEL